LNSIIPLTIIHSCMRHTNQWINWQASNLHFNNNMIELFLCNNGWREICNSVTWFYSFSFLCNNSIQFNSIPSLSLSLSLWVVIDSLLLRIFNFQFAIQKHNTSVDVGSIIHHTFLINCPHSQINFFFINKICFKPPFSVSCCMHHPSSHLRVLSFQLLWYWKFGELFLSQKIFSKIQLHLHMKNQHTFLQIFPFFLFFFGGTKITCSNLNSSLSFSIWFLFLSLRFELVPRN